jgi:hypothetical protein
MTTAVKAKLSVVLKANELVIAEVEDAILWQDILTAINSGKSNLDSSKAPEEKKIEGQNGTPDKGKESDHIGKLATQLGITTDLVNGGCSPSNSAPYLHLDAHCWEAMKKALPSRGTSAIAPVVVAATLLGLWFQKTGLGNPTQAQAQEVLGTVNVTDKNSSRAIQNTSWLQGRTGGQIVLNPAEISKAIKLAKCFCTKQWAEWKE